MVNKITLFLLCLVLAVNLSPVPDRLASYHGGQPLRSNGIQSCVPDQVIVKLAYLDLGKQSGPNVLHARYLPRIAEVRFHRYTGYYVCRLQPGSDPEELLRDLMEDPLVEKASLNHRAHLAMDPPDDHYFVYQYALFNSGQVFYPGLGLTGVEGSDIKALGGWDWSTGERDVVVAVIDTGVALYHQDLSSKMVPGYNFVDDNLDTYDDNGHGTLVASIAAADSNNSIGVAGVCWGAMIMPVKCFDSMGDGSYLAIASGIRFAADQGAQVINMSFSGEADSFILEDACQYAFLKGCVLVAATGNDGAQVLYPARYDEYCLAVGASNSSDQLADFSNFGPQVDVVAPGVDVFGALYSPDEPDNIQVYGWGSGTSFAAPHVSGAAALLLSYKSDLPNVQVMDLIKYTADDVNDRFFPGIDIYMGFGRINLKTLLAPFILD